MLNHNNISKIILENPLIISLLIYIIICLIIYFVKPNSMFGEVNTSEDEDENRFKRLFQKNIKIIFIILPFIIYGLVCILSSLITRKTYCEMLKNKEVDIKNLLKKCKN